MLYVSVHPLESEIQIQNQIRATDQITYFAEHANCAVHTFSSRVLLKRKHYENSFEILSFFLSNGNGAVSSMYLF